MPGTVSGMRIALLGTGRMGTELALRLLDPGHHEVVVWNRTADRTTRAVAAGARHATTPQETIDGADVVLTCLFGPDDVREAVTSPDLLPPGTVWADVTTVSPADATRFAAWAQGRGVRYVHSPVVGTLAPARAGKLGVYVGGTDPQARDLVEQVVSAYADPDRLQQVDTAAGAAMAKLLANLALAVSAQGLVEALRLGASQGLPPERTLDLLKSTGLGFIAGMKGPTVLSGETADAQFSTNAIAKDVRLMLRSCADPLPATTAALESLTQAQRAGLGEHDFSAIMLPETAGERD